MENYSRYEEKIRWVYLYKTTEEIECIVTTFYSKGSLVQYAYEIVTKPVKLFVGDDVIVKFTGHEATISKVVKRNKEFDYALTSPSYYIEPPDLNSGPWYFRRNLF